MISKSGIVLSNTVGVIDSDFRGEIICLVKNDSDLDFTIHPGDRLAQLAFFPVYRVKWETVTELTESERGEGGFGSTGIWSQPVDYLPHSAHPKLLQHITANSAIT